MYICVTLSNGVITSIYAYDKYDIKLKRKRFGEPIMYTLLWLDAFNSLRPSDICVNKLAIVSSDNGLSPDRRQAIFWTNDGMLFIGPWETNFN